MRHLAPILLFIVLFSGCKSSRQSIVTTKKKADRISSSQPFKDSENDRAMAVVQEAINYEGVRYRYGGTSSKGMDCSGLIYVSFKKENIDLPRISDEMARSGQPLQLDQVREGDLLFFKTAKGKNKINHVGLVTERRDNTIIFIHSTTSRGVIRSSMDESYWNRAFIAARRIL